MINYVAIHLTNISRLGAIDQTHAQPISSVNDHTSHHLNSVVYMCFL